MQMNDRHLARVRSEYREMPGLKLTAAQASRFWNLGPEESRVALETLVEARILWRTSDGHWAAYRRIGFEAEAEWSARLTDPLP